MVDEQLDVIPVSTQTNPLPPTSHLHCPRFPPGVVIHSDPANASTLESMTTLMLLSAFIAIIAAADTLTRANEIKIFFIIDF